MDKSLLDTDIFSEVLKAKNPSVVRIALQHGLVLVTGNTKHFERIVELGFPLALQDWRL